jgi:hypothetical protein
MVFQPHHIKASQHAEYEFQQRNKIDRIPPLEDIQICCKIYVLHCYDVFSSKKDFFAKTSIPVRFILYEVLSASRYYLLAFSVKLSYTFKVRKIQVVKIILFSDFYSENRK